MSRCGGGGCRHATPSKPAAAAPRKIVLDYRYGWYHSATGSQTIRQIATEYQRDIDLVAKLNRLGADARPPARQMIYIPPNNDVAYVRQALIRINEHPELVPTEPWRPPLLKNPVADIKPGIETKSAWSGLKTMVRGRKSQTVVDEPTRTDEDIPLIKQRAVGGGKFAWPVQGKVVTPFNEGWQKACHGIEIAAEAGTPVTASRTGKVLLANEFPGYGQLVLIDHGDGMASVYAYLETIKVREGQQVEQGRQIATVGRKGSRPLCFFQIRRQGKKVDPMPYLK